jgi:hypothetical protein
MGGLRNVKRMGDERLSFPRFDKPHILSISAYPVSRTTSYEYGFAVSLWIFTALDAADRHKLLE